MDTAVGSYPMAVFFDVVNTPHSAIPSSKDEIKLASLGIKPFFISRINASILHTL